MHADLMSKPRVRLLELLKRNGATTIDNLVEMIGLSKTATRAHLIKLETAGLIERVSAMSSSVGRPPLTYTITRDGGRVFPSDDVALLTDLLMYIGDRNEELVSGFFQQLWDDRRSEFDAEIAYSQADHLDGRQLTLTRLLERTRFMPEVRQEQTDDGVEVIVRECNCPFPAAVRASRIPCEMEMAFLEDALGGKCVAADLANTRDEVCTFRLQIAAP